MPGTQEEYDSLGAYVGSNQPVSTKPSEALWVKGAPGYEGSQDYRRIVTPNSADLVNRPPHYNQGDIECIDYLKDNLSPEGFRGYLEGNVKKYAHRFRYKGGVQDLEKSEWYLKKLIEELKHG